MKLVAVLLVACGRTSEVAPADLNVPTVVMADYCDSPIALLTDDGGCVVCGLRRYPCCGDGGCVKGNGSCVYRGDGTRRCDQ